MITVNGHHQYEVNAICVPRRPNPDLNEERQFAQHGGYPIFNEHRNNEFYFAGWGDHGYLIPGNANYQGLTRTHYNEMRHVRYVLDGDLNNLYQKLRQVQVGEESRYRSRILRQILSTKKLFHALVIGYHFGSGDIISD